MKLHVAIREGMKKVNEGHVYFEKIRPFGDGGYDHITVKGDMHSFKKGEPVFAACALGTAYFGANGTPQDEWDARTRVYGFPAFEIVPFLREHCGSIVDLEVEYPTTEWYREAISAQYHDRLTMPMWAAIEQLFEGAKWNRQMVADFVASYEDYNRK